MGKNERKKRSKSNDDQEKDRDNKRCKSKPENDVPIAGSSRSSRQLLSQQKWKVSERVAKNLNDNRSSNSSEIALINPELDGKHTSLKVKRSLINELDKIDAEFEAELQKPSEGELIAPDGIRITVNCEEDKEFSEEDLDYDEVENETIYPVPTDSDDAETIAGHENILNESRSSTTIISFNLNKARRESEWEKVQTQSDCLLTPNENFSERVPGQVIAEMTPEELVKANPALREMVQNLIQENQPQQHSKITTSKEAKSSKGMSNSELGKNQVQQTKNNELLVKSPSDTMVYAPALKLTPQMNPSLPMKEVVNQGLRKDNMNHECGNQSGRNQVNAGNVFDGQIINKITAILDQVRVENEQKGTEDRRDIQIHPSTSTGRPRVNQLEQADEVAQEYVVQAERFKAATELPRGMHENLNENLNEFAHDQNRYSMAVNPPMHLASKDTEIPINNQRINGPVLSQTQGISDDEFFHLTCHVDANLRQKIQRGEYVDLEKLLTKDKFKGNQQNYGQRMELVSRGGKTYIMPLDKENKITNVRRWEQAFRIYAAIYSQMNPHQSAEIWQYVFVINSAASTYAWENNCKL